MKVCIFIFRMALFEYQFAKAIFRRYLLLLTIGFGTGYYIGYNRAKGNATILDKTLDNLVQKYLVKPHDQPSSNTNPPHPAPR